MKIKDEYVVSSRKLGELNPGGRRFVPAWHDELRDFLAAPDEPELRGQRRVLGFRSVGSGVSPGFTSPRIEKDTVGAEPVGRGRKVTCPGDPKRQFTILMPLVVRQVQLRYVEHGHQPFIPQAKLWVPQSGEQLRLPL